MTAPAQVQAPKTVVYSSFSVGGQDSIGSFSHVQTTPDGTFVIDCANKVGVPYRFSVCPRGAKDIEAAAKRAKQMFASLVSTKGFVVTVSPETEEKEKTGRSPSFGIHVPPQKVNDFIAAFSAAAAPVIPHKPQGFAQNTSQRCSL